MVEKTSLRLGNGSQTVNCRRFSCQAKPSLSGWDVVPETPKAPARSDWNQPVEPKPVAMIIPDDDWVSWPFHDSR
ncbi:hypothetical protein AADEFJLK_02503 [Methylovulum psychrotolerans]|uniref:Uncharacterized protein n=1 Tax=Methylovulum psychrotolerans TaxID=1704499 RepID=A0A2S5CLD9_9GAMM|nr:hypothetical protein AADEFJLK_02503 [Methylovulum psychrotolerans]